MIFVKRKHEKKDRGKRQKEVRERKK